MYARIFSRAALVVAFVTATAIPIAAFFVRGPDKPETWIVSAASLAVITSVLAAWSSRRVLELQEDAQRPSPVVSLDFASRYSLVLVKVTNAGGTIARNICLEWDVDLKDHEGKIIGFVRVGDDPGISILMPGESISQVIGVPYKFLEAHPNSAYTGSITFQDASGMTYRSRFWLDGRSQRGTPNYAEERPKTEYELQQIPKELRDIKKLLERWIRESGI